MSLKITAAEIESSRGHIYAIIRAVREAQLIFVERVALDRAPERQAFARQLAEIDRGTDQADVERTLLQIFEQSSPDPNDEGASGDEDPLGTVLAKGSQATRVVEIAKQLDLFHTPDRVPYATMPVATHSETWPLVSMETRDWISHRFYELHQTVPNAQALSDALATLRGQALFEGPERAIHTRVAELGGCVYLDLADAEWRAVEIGPTGWRVIADAPVRFRRPHGLRALPEPVWGGSIYDLRPFVNVGTGPEADDAFRLLASWLVMTLHPSGPYPILQVYGEQGSGKSFFQRLLRDCVDPNTAPLRSQPRDEGDLVLAALNGWAVGLDNLSYLPQWLSDALCRVATGGGLGKRQLYSDAAEVLINVKRPSLLNGIAEVATSPDLEDRSVTVYLYRYDKRTRRTEKKLEREFAAVHGRILGGLLDAVVCALRNAPSIPEDNLPRMADFAIFGMAAAPALGWTGKAFLGALERNRAAINDVALNSSPLYEPIKRLVDFGPFAGLVSDLLTQLENLADDRHKKHKIWPKDPARLGGALRRLAPALGIAGIDVQFPPRHADGSWVEIARMEEDGESSTEASEPGDRVGNAGNAADAVTSSEGMPFSSAANERRPGTEADPTERQPGDDAASGPKAVADVGSASNSPFSLEGWEFPSEGRYDDGVLSGDALEVPVETETDDDQPGAPVEKDGLFQRSGQITCTTYTAYTDAPDDIALVTESAQLEALLPDLMAAPVIGVDTETTGLDPRSHRLRLVQLAVPGRTVVVDCFQVDPRALAGVFAQGRCFAGHHLAFDLGFLDAAGLPLPNGDRLFDTMLAAQLLGAGGPDGRLDQCSLAKVTARLLGIELDKRLQKADWPGAISSDMLTYAGRDGQVLLPLVERLQRELADVGLTRAAVIEMGALPAIAWLERAGAPFDADGWTRLSDAAVVEQVRLDRALSEIAGTEDLFGDSTMNWGSPAQVAKLLKDRGHEIESTDEATLQRLIDVEPLARLLLEHREATRKASAYGIEFLRFLHAGTKRIHPDYLQLGAATGRMSCAKPNLQQVPRDPAYRACFCPGEGRVLIKADYSQIELRIAAQIAKEARMLEAYRNGEDLHAVTAAAVLGRSNGSVTPDDRQAAKALNFGLIYGMGAATLRDHASSGYGVKLSQPEAERFRDRFFSTYPGLRRWHRSMTDGAIDTRTLAGRRRLGVARFTEKLNSPVQGSGADGLKAALALLWETRSECPSALPVLCVHDEIVIECDESSADPTKEWLVRCMEEGMATVVTEVPVVAEAKIIRDWSGA